MEKRYIDGEILGNYVDEAISKTVVEELFKCSGYRVYRFGYENVIQNLTQIDKKLGYSEVDKAIREIPDFIVVEEIGGKKSEAYFVEVKLRRGAIYDDKFQMWNIGKLILVIPEDSREYYFYVIDIPVIKKLLKDSKNGRLYVDERLPKEFIPLEKDPTFKFGSDERMIKDNFNYVKKWFKPKTKTVEDNSKKKDGNT